MKPARFEYYRPAELDEALELMGRFGVDARVIAGGQSLVPMMNLRMATPDVLIDVAAISELSGITIDADHVKIGAMTRQAMLLEDASITIHLPLLAAAASHIGHFQTRSRGTVGGSLAHADPSAEISLVMVTLGATIKLQSARGQRIIGAREFFVDALTTAIEEGEMLTEISVPISPPKTTVVFREFARRHGDFAIAGVAVQYYPAEKRLLAGVGAVGPIPHFCAELSNTLWATNFGLAVLNSAVESEIEQIDAISDLNATASYRRHLGKTLLIDGIKEALSK